MTEKNGNDHPRVIETINKAIGLDASNQADLAVELLTTLATEFPDASAVHGYLGWFLSQSGRHEEAIEQSQQAVVLAPNSEKVSLVYFFTLWHAGMRMEAFDEMKRFVKIRPSKEYDKMIKEWESNSPEEN